MHTEHHVLLVGGMRFNQDYLRRLPGVRTTLMVSADGIKPKDVQNNERVIGVTGSTSEEWFALASAIHKIDPFTAIGAFHEFDQMHAAVIARRLGLQFHSPETIEYCTNKASMRARLLETGIDSTPCEVVRTQSEIISFGRSYGYPLIVKPLDGWGSIGIAVVTCDDDVDRALARSSTYDISAPLLVEPLLAGNEFSVEILSENGVHCVICITQKYKSSRTYVEYGHIIPAPLSTEHHAELDAFSKRVLTALGVRNGVTHTEIMLTSNGPRMIETHTRAAGDFIPDLIELVFGINLFETWARQVVGESVLENLSKRIHDVDIRPYGAVWYGGPKRHGHIARLHHVDRASAMPGVQRLEILKVEGDFVGPVESSFDRVACVLSLGSTPPEAMSSAQRALDVPEVDMTEQGESEPTPFRAYNGQT